MIERARPLLGTFVSVRVEELPAAQAHRAIESAFAAVSAIHRLMSFQDPRSELGGLNRARPGEPVELHAHTWRVLRWSAQLCRLTHGSFDATTQRTGTGFRLLPGKRAVRTGPAQIDLSGIAKGYAVDLAVLRLRAQGVRHALVNAGGDLRVLGGRCEAVALRVPGGAAVLGVIELAGGALASSDATDGSGRTATVCARRCLLADALTKPVLAQALAPQAVLPVLRRFGARAWLHAPATGWRMLDPAAECVDAA